MLMHSPVKYVKNKKKRINMNDKVYIAGSLFTQVDGRFWKK